MDSGNVSLLQFLRKQSLHSNASSHHQSSQRSNYSKQNSAQFRTPKKNILKQNFSRQQFQTPNYSKIYSNKQQSNFTFSPFQYGNSVSNSLSESRSYDDFEEQEYESTSYRNPEIENSKVSEHFIWPRRVSEYSNIQSEKMQSVRLLQKLQSKLRGQIESINKKINNFNSQMMIVINEELQHMKQKIYKMVDDIFKESDKYVQQYIEAQEKQLTGDLVYIREKLQTEYVKIETMKEEINGPNWQQVGREITADLEQKIESLTQRSATQEIGKWQRKDLFNYHMRDIQESLVDIIKFKEKY